MALGAITSVQVAPENTTSPVVVGGLKCTVTNVVGDSAYAAGGSVLSTQQLGLPTNVLFTQAEAIATTGSNNGASSFYYNTATGKLQCFTTGATGALNECGSVNLSGLTIQIMAFGY